MSAIEKRPEKAINKAPTALILIDVINDLEFAGGEQLLNHAVPMAEHIVALKNRAKLAGIPVIYVNDNFSDWQASFDDLLKRCLENPVRGRPLAEMLRPDADDYFVLKPRHSGFFSTSLDFLLDYLQTKTLILTGLAANTCVLFTANDAYMRKFGLYIPADCVASNTIEDNEHALELMRKVLKANVQPSYELNFGKFKRKSKK